MNEAPAARAGTAADRIARAAAACMALVALAAQGDEPGSTDSSWTVIDLQQLAQFATRDAVVTAAPDRGPGVIRVSAVDDPWPVFDYPGLGRQMCDNCTFIHLRGVTFDDGIIEVDINSQRTVAEDREQKGFAGLIFNLDPAMRSWESVYFRPHYMVEAGGEGKSVQYVRMPGENWFFLRGGSAALKDGELVDTTNYQEVDVDKPSKYEGTAKGIAPGQWFTARIVVAGDEVVAFVRPEGAREFSRVLRVDSFNEPAATGLIGFYTEPLNTTFFRNARYLRMSAQEAAAWLAREP